MSRQNAIACTVTVALALLACSKPSGTPPSAADCTRPPAAPTRPRCFPMPGLPNALAKDSLPKIVGTAAPRDVVDNGLITDELAISFKPDATVAQVNAALAAVDGAVTSAAPGEDGVAFVSVILRAPVSRNEMRSDIERLRGMPGIAHVFWAQVPPSRAP